jgi:NitT/TauT family transport system permease protein
MKKLLTIRSDIGKSWYIAGAVASFVGVLLLWLVLSWLELVDKTFLPTPVMVIKNFATAISENTLIGDMSISVFRITMGFLLAAILGIPLGILAGTFKIAESFIQPLSEFIRYMPVPAFIPLIMVWTGIGEEAKIMVIFIGTFFQLVLMVADNARAVSDDLLSSAYTLGAGEWQVITKVLIPAMAPKIMDTLRLMFGWAWTYLVVAELVAANSGLGYSILKAQRFLKTDSIFTGILLIGVLGLLTDRLFYIANKKLFGWAEEGV